MRTLVQRCCTVGIATLVACLSASTVTAGPWLRFRTAHFTVEGNAAVADLQAVANRLEQLHAVVATAAKGRLATAAPTVVTVFADAAAMAPYLPVVSGGKPTSFAASTPLREHLVMAAGSGEVGYREIYREYVHRLLDGLFAATPPWWASEGLAEFYSSFKVAPDEKSAELGLPPENYERVLAERMPSIPQVVSADMEAVRRLDGPSREAYFAASWGLIHYILIENSTRRGQLVAFMDKLASGMASDAAFQATFGDPSVLERELRQNVSSGGLFRTRAVALPAASGRAPEPRTLGDADVEALLGRLLLEENRQADVEPHLAKAVALNPRSGDVDAAVGLLRLKEGRVADAVESLQKSAALAPDEPEAHLALGYAAVRLLQEGAPAVRVPRLVETARTALSRALELDPDRPMALALMARALTLGTPELARAQALLEHAIELSPARDDFRLTLAEILAQRDQLDQARALATRLAQTGSTAERRERAALLAREITSRQRTATRQSSDEAEKARADAARQGAAAGLKSGKRQVVLDLRRPEAGESQTRGRLVEVECRKGSVVIHVEAAGKMWKFVAPAFEDIELLSYRDDGSPQIACGTAKITYPVVLTWRKAESDEGALVAGTDGVAVALEVLPDGM